MNQRQKYIMQKAEEKISELRVMLDDVMYHNEPLPENEQKKIREKGFEYDSKKKKYIKKRVPKEFAIILNGVRHNLIKPDVEDCKRCSLDKFCDKFKEALCNSLIGGYTGMIFEKENSLKDKV